MKGKGQEMTSDGFDKNVAEKMPKIKQQEEPLSLNLEIEPNPLNEARQGMRPLETEKKMLLPSSKEEMETEQNMDVLGLIEDLHNQLLVSSRTKRAFEMDLASFQKTIHQLTQENKDLRDQVEGLKKEVQRYKEVQSESVYLKEENADALERIQILQQELRSLNETFTRAAHERDEGLHRIHELESQSEQNEFLKIKGRLKEREASHFFQENRELQSKLEEALAQNLELQRKHDALRKSFNEVKESLALLRDAYKSNYYNLPETPE